MATGNVNKPRRKPLTYGKATRKHAVDSDPASKVSHHENQFTKLVLDGGRNIQWDRAGRGTSADMMRSHGAEELTKTPAILRNYTTASRNKVESQSRSPAPARVVAASKVGTPRPSAVRQLSPDDRPDDLAIFEYPMDDSEGIKKLQTQSPTSRKRKRVALLVDGSSASVSNIDGLQPQASPNQRLDKIRHCQASQPETIGLEHTTKTMRTPRRSSPENSSPTHGPAAPGTAASCGRAQSEQRILRGDDPRIHEAHVRNKTQKLEKPNVVPAVSWAFNSKTDDSESAVQGYVTPKLMNKSISLRRIESTKSAACPDIIIDNADVHDLAGTAGHTTPPVAANEDHLLERTSEPDKADLPQNEGHKLDGQVTVGFGAQDRCGGTNFMEDMQKLVPVREGFTKIGYAMKQHCTSRAPFSCRSPWSIDNKGQEMDGLGAKKSFQAGPAAREASGTTGTESTDRGQSQDIIPVKSPAAAASSQEDVPKVTYARQRSYLTENALEGNEQFSMPIEFDSDCRPGRRRRGERSVLPVISPLVGSQEEESAVGGPSGRGVRSIHELREAGEKHKFVHGVESLLDDLEDKESWTLSQKRSTLLTLATKLAVPECALRFIECGLEQRLFDLEHSENDPIASFVLASTIMFLFCNRSSKSPISRSQYAGVKEFLVALLTAEEDVTRLARDRRNNMSRVSRSELLAFRTLVEQSPIWRYKRPGKISSQLIVLTVLDTMIHKVREAGDGSGFLSQDTLEQLVEISQLHRSSKSGSSENLECDAATGRLALSILDACTMAGRPTTDAVKWSSGFAAKVLALLPPMSGTFGGDAAESRNLVLRLYLNLTNNDPSLCDKFAKSKVITAIFDIVDSHFLALSQNTASEVGTPLLDNLILSLGSLINVVEFSDAARGAFLTAQSGNDSSILDRLLQLYLDRVRLASKASGHPPRTRAAIDRSRWIRLKVVSATYRLAISRCS